MSLITAERFHYTDNNVYTENVMIPYFILNSTGESDIKYYWSFRCQLTLTFYASREFIFVLRWTKSDHISLRLFNYFFQRAVLFLIEKIICAYPVIKMVKVNIARKPHSIHISGDELAIWHVWSASYSKM